MQLTTEESKKLREFKVLLLGFSVEIDLCLQFLDRLEKRNPNKKPISKAKATKNSIQLMIRASHRSKIKGLGK